MRITDTCVYFHGFQDIYSQWYGNAPFTHFGITFRTAEHWMMVRKLILFCYGNPSVKKVRSIIAAEQRYYERTRKHQPDSIYAMLVAPTPREVKALGRLVSGFNETAWMENVPNILKEGNKLKFEQNPREYEHFKSMKGKIFVEASKTDLIYGVGLGQNDPRIEDKSNWKGSNILGDVLTELNNEMFSK